VTLSVQHLGDDAMREAASGIDAACRQLAAYDVDLIYFLGVPPIVLEGPGYHRQLADRMSQTSGVPALTDLCGVLEAMQHLNIRKVALATPFEQVVNERIKLYLEAEGIAVTGASCLGMNRNADIRRLPIRVEYDLARKTYLESSPRADGIYIACGSWGSIHNVPRLEKELGTQVVSWMNAFLWAPMRRHGVTDEIQGFGKLLGSAKGKNEE
jgi:maleate cis-trans isomerase